MVLTKLDRSSSGQKAKLRSAFFKDLTFGLDRIRVTLLGYLLGKVRS